MPVQSTPFFRGAYKPLTMVICFSRNIVTSRSLQIGEVNILYIDEQIQIPINGVQQYISIRSEKEQAPLLLYLHGGPGDAALPLMLKFNRELERFFKVVIWEQRGTGKSYYPFIKGHSVTIETFVEDLHQLTIYLLKRFNCQKIFLVGHSWGSVLGLHFIQEHPEYIHTYIGCGQVVNIKKSCQIAYNYALEHAGKREKCKLEKIDCSYSGDNWQHDLLFVTKQVVRHKGSLYGNQNYNKLIVPFLLSKYYTIEDLINRQKGSLQSIRFLWQELMLTDFEGITQFDCPVIFAEGRHDKHVSSDLVEDYYNKLHSKKQLVWFEYSCHFPHWSENQKFNQLLARLI